MSAAPLRAVDTDRGKIVILQCQTRLAAPRKMPMQQIRRTCRTTKIGTRNFAKSGQQRFKQIIAFTRYGKIQILKMQCEHRKTCAVRIGWNFFDRVTRTKICKRCKTRSAEPKKLLPGFSKVDERPIRYYCRRKWHKFST